MKISQRGEVFVKRALRKEKKEKTALDIYTASTQTTLGFEKNPIKGVQKA